MLKIDEKIFEKIIIGLINNIYFGDSHQVKTGRMEAPRRRTAY